MEIFDLTHEIKDRMPVYPGTKEPRITKEFDIKKDGFEERKIEIYSHNGTHMDAPAHIVPGGKNLTNYELWKFIGRGVVVDVSKREKLKITLKDFKQEFQRLQDQFPIEFCFLYTGWDEKWGDACYFKQWPYLTEDLAEYLSDQKLKGIGIDGPSVDSMENPMEDNTLKAHKKILGRDMIIIENLKGLYRLLNMSFEFYGLPLYVQGAEGSPIRAIAVVQPEKGGD